jgi:prepilin-type N-terminal cleavage/methylation domain-containing protein
MIMRQKGMTMMELMWVLLIISILIAISVPAFNSYLLKSKIDNVEIELRAMKSSISQYTIDNSGSDFDKDILKSYFDYELVEVDSGNADLVELNTKIKMDPWKNPYVINYPSEGFSFITVMSYGPNRKKDLSETSVGDDIVMIYYTK